MADDEGKGMHLGFVSAILPELGLEEVLQVAADSGIDCVEVMCWPKGPAERRYATDFIGAPFFVGVHDRLGVRVRAEAMAARDQLAAQLEVVVDLAVEGNPPATVATRHGLMAGRTEIENGQPRGTEPQTLAAGFEPSAIAPFISSARLRACSIERSAHGPIVTRSGRP